MTIFLLFITDMLTIVYRDANREMKGLVVASHCIYMS